MKAPWTLRFLTFGALYVVLSLPFAPRENVVRAFSRSLLERVFGTETATASVHAETELPFPAPLDAGLHLRLTPGASGTTQGGEGAAGLDSQAVLWAPYALLLSLVAATPGSTREVLLRLGLASLLWLSCGGLILGSFGLSTLCGAGIMTAAPLLKYAADLVSENLIGQIGPSTALPVFLWLLLCARPLKLGSLFLRLSSPAALRPEVSSSGPRI